LSPEGCIARRRCEPDTENIVSKSTVEEYWVRVTLYKEAGFFVIRVVKYLVFIILCRFLRAPTPTMGRPESLAPKGPGKGHSSGLFDLVSESMSPDH
jgi:hypothetical protein